MKILGHFLIGAIGLFTLACSGSKSTQDSVAGTVTYREKMLLPPEAVVVVKLIDASLQDVPAKVISVDTLKTQATPIPYALPFNRSNLEEGHTYQVQAAIYVDGDLRMISTQATRANLQEHSPVEVLVSSIQREVTEAKKQADFIARGNEPFWTLEMEIGKAMHLKQLHSDEVVSVPFPKRFTDPKTREIVLKSFTEAHTLEVRIAEENCQDSMADESFEYSVKVILDNDQVLSGCGYLTGEAKSLRLDYELRSGFQLDLKLANRIPELSIDLLRGTYNANDGCNGIGGELDERENTLRFKPGFSTEMYCGNDFDQDFKKLFLDVDGYQFNNNGDLDLTIEGAAVLSYSKKKAPLSDSVINDLHDLFVVTEINGMAIPKGQENPRIEFYPAEGRVSGYSGCNQFNGPIEVSEKSLRFSPQMAMTKKYCQGSVEDAFVAALPSVNSYIRKERSLMLLGADGAVVLLLQKTD